MQAALYKESLPGQLSELVLQENACPDPPTRKGGLPGAGTEPEPTRKGGPPSRRQPQDASGLSPGAVGQRLKLLKGQQGWT